jgi:ubiquinone/menaquinone biosynthesis C-methylase UbiE
MGTRLGAEFQRGFEFDGMARRPMYAVCPRWLLEHCEVGPESTVVDLGCGSGIFTRFLLERFPTAPRLRIVAVDPSEFELAIMKSRITDDRVRYVQGRAQEAAEVVPRVDAAILCNVLHQIPAAERRPVFDVVFGLLEPGGAVGANTLFYEGGIPEDTREFYLVWMMHVRDYLRKRSIELETPKETPVALQRISSDQHAEMLSATGFSEIEIEEVDTEWKFEDWQALSAYSVFVQGALAPNVDVAIGSRALIESAWQAYEVLGIETVRRGWLHCAARHP